MRAGRPGSKHLAKVMADRPRYVNLLLLLRLTCEAAGTVLLTLAAVQLIDPRGSARSVPAWRWWWSATC